jgi:hypothetical protein
MLGFTSAASSIICYRNCYRARPSFRSRANHPSDEEGAGPPSEGARRTSPLRCSSVRARDPRRRRGRPSGDRCRRSRARRARTSQATTAPGRERRGSGCRAIRRARPARSRRRGSSPGSTGRVAASTRPPSVAPEKEGRRASLDLAAREQIQEDVTMVDPPDRAIAVHRTKSCGESRLWPGRRSSTNTCE